MTDAAGEIHEWLVSREVVHFPKVFFSIDAVPGRKGIDAASDQGRYTLEWSRNQR